MSIKSRARVTVIGAGYLGLTHAVCLADLGYEVLAIDVDADRIARAARGAAPVFEPASNRCCVRTWTRDDFVSGPTTARPEHSAIFISSVSEHPRRARTAGPT